MTPKRREALQHFYDNGGEICVRDFRRTVEENLAVINDPNYPTAQMISRMLRDGEITQYWGGHAVFQRLTDLGRRRLHGDNV